MGEARKMEEDMPLAEIERLRRRVAELESRLADAEQKVCDCEEQSRAFSQASFDAVFLSEHGVCIAQNQAAEAMFGFTDSQVLGKDFRELLAPEYRGTAGKDIAIAPGGACEAVALRRDGTTFPCEIVEKNVTYQGRTVQAKTFRDITRRKMKEEPLRESEELFRLLFAHSLDGIFITEPNGKVFKANRAACRMLGRSEEEVCLVGRDGIIDQTDLRLAAALEERARTGYFSGELNFKRSDGTIFPASLSSSVFGLQQGHVRTSTIFRDLTEQKQLEQELRESRAELQAIYDNAPVMMCVLDSQRRVLYVNRAFADFVCRSEEELKGGLACGVFGCINALDDPRGCGYGPGCASCTILAALEDTLSTGVVHRGVEYRTTLIGSGTPRDVVLLGATALIPSRGRPGVLLCLEDVTEPKRIEAALRESEERYRAFFQTSRDWVFMTTLDGRFLDFNDVAMEKLGYTLNERDEVLTQNVTSLYARPEEREAHARLVADKGFSKEYPIDIRKKDGTVIHTLVTTVARKDREGKVVGFQGTVRDITEQKKAEAEREALINQLLQAQKMEAIGTLTAGIAHNFNNLLTVIIGFAELILAELTEDNPHYEDLQRILETGLQGAGMVKHLTAFSRQEEISLSPLNINTVVADAVSLMRRTFSDAITIETSLEPDLDIVNADPSQVEQTLMNVCINSREAMPNGGLLRIKTGNALIDEQNGSLYAGARPGQYVIIEISDTGTGMTVEQMNRIFDPFFTTKGWDFRKGVGLGLSVAKGIVEQHGGWITSQSEPGKGTIFRLYFPAVDDSEVTGELARGDDNEGPKLSFQN
jgi:PAS domain S-box-containing protein